MGLCRLPRTVCERVGERWRDGSGSLRALGYPVTKMLAHMLARAVDAVDFRLSRDGDGTVPAAAHSLRACRGAMARPRRQLACLGYPVTPMVAHVLARAVGAADRSTTEKRRRGSSRWMSGRACVCLYGYARKSIGSKRRNVAWRAVATVGCRVKAIAKGVAACVSCEHACTRLLHARMQVDVQLLHWRWRALRTC